MSNISVIQFRYCPSDGIAAMISTIVSNYEQPVKGIMVPDAVRNLHRMHIYAVGNIIDHNNITITKDLLAVVAPSDSAAVRLYQDWTDHIGNVIGIFENNAAEAKVTPGA